MESSRPKELATRKPELFKEGVQTYHGSCHCGAVKFEVDLDLQYAKTNRCNCSFCAKARQWGIVVKPEQFRLVAGADNLSVYRFGSKSGDHCSCKTCAIKTHGTGYVEQLGGAFVGAIIACIDDLSEEQKDSLIYSHSNGKDDLWWEEPKFKNHL
ncbi:hypothetical protein DFA_10235 [Cavenderia fasciculata]|uniref:CENP-V/GFA domain-containing protein n=1 Tax=Cavenderia fasciculata TaxID=261658 RepID=F4Q9N1_CACFS|nr:uncharacterized protein DFA_10235 [Cavenderia fasciculata]EGG15400.1 hypothetical protein DFA_10235 [Cavenderia fasciculata]|eukprot:XP_004354142.1 hypothetical protein DFA_10235 [Cavenderia fasciculata]